MHGKLHDFILLVHFIRGYCMPHHARCRPIKHKVVQVPECSERIYSHSNRVITVDGHMIKTTLLLKDLSALNSFAIKLAPTFIESLGQALHLFMAYTTWLKIVRLHGVRGQT